MSLQQTLSHTIPYKGRHVASMRVGIPVTRPPLTTSAQPWQKLSEFVIASSMLTGMAAPVVMAADLMLSSVVAGASATQFKCAQPLAATLLPVPPAGCLAVTKLPWSQVARLQLHRRGERGSTGRGRSVTLGAMGALDHMRKAGWMRVPRSRPHWRAAASVVWRCASDVR